MPNPADRRTVPLKLKVAGASTGIGAGVAATDAVRLTATGVVTAGKAGAGRTGVEAAAGIAVAGTAATAGVAAATEAGDGAASGAGADFTGCAQPATTTSKATAQQGMNERMDGGME